MYKFKYPRGHLKFEPLTMAAATAIAGGLSAGSSIASTISGANMNRKNRQWSAEQNQLNRDFQAQEAMKAREWQEDFYNTYQSPSAQIKQYQEAGLNPALMYGSGFNPGSTPSGATPSGGSSISPTTENPLKGFDLGQSLMDVVRMQNEISALEYENKVREATARELNSKALLNGETLTLTKKQGNKIDKEIEQIGKNMELTDEQIKKIKKEVVNLNWDNSLKEYQCSVNDDYKAISQKLNLPVPMTQELLGDLCKTIGSLAGDLFGGFFNIFRAFGGKRSSGIQIPKEKPLKKSSYKPGEVVELY